MAPFADATAAQAAAAQAIHASVAEVVLPRFTDLEAEEEEEELLAALEESLEELRGEESLSGGFDTTVSAK
eukprot:CAMPEP_0179151910 /NCGR_PEP_ID=MMETSP0796-20121207/73791_1 /TAXON_ID=73915 /ORGANISM="Pyrodinium bahamense, Strain pbaha01" /LENGTH=70 /DNA_ID=CAMNT_0020853071 /DNA_START=1 /DNA_END=210 /DNA_ORIENTATION=+